MFDGNEMLIPRATNAVLSKAYDSFAAEEWPPKEKKLINGQPDLKMMNSTRKKEIALRKRETERINRIHFKRSGVSSFQEWTSKRDKATEKESVDSKSNKLKKKEKVEEKVATENKLKPAKSKAFTAFGTTFYKTENEVPVTAKKKPSSTSEKFGKLKGKRARESEDEDGKNALETKVPGSKKNSPKIADNGEEGKGKGKTKGGKSSRSVQGIELDGSVQDGKYSGEAKKSSKAKVITAFGSTFRKTENDLIPLPKKKTSSFTEKLMKSGKSGKVRDHEAEVAATATTTTSMIPSKLEVIQSETKLSLSRNKLTEMVEEGNKDRGRGRGAFSTSAGKKGTPYQSSSEANGNAFKLGVEGDEAVGGVNFQTKEKVEIGKEMSLFEKIQQNVRSYFSMKSSEMGKFEDEKKRVHEGEWHPNDESISIRREDGIVKDAKNLVMINHGEGMKGFLENDSGFVEKGDFPEGNSMTKRNGSGPGGNPLGDRIDRTNYINEKIYEKVNYKKRGIEYTEKRRETSFHRSKTLQKNALAEPSSSASIGFGLESGEQVQNFSSAYGVASAFAQVQEFHQEITRIVQEECLTPIVNCLPGELVTEWTRREENRTGVCRSRSQPISERRSNLPVRTAFATHRKIRSSRSERAVYEGNALVRSVTDRLQRGDDPRREQPMEVVSKTFKPEKVQFVPRRTRWFVYSLTETSECERKSMEMPRRQENATATEVTPKADLANSAGVEKFDVEDDRKSSIRKSEVTPSLTLKEIISLSRRIFQECEENKIDSATGNRGESNEHQSSRDGDLSLGYYLEKLMEEKRNYLNLERTKNLRKSQKANFIADSFNFFNVLNREFLSLKTSNPRIEKLRTFIAENKNSNMEEYLGMYKKVIRNSLTELEQCLMDKAKMELERYTDMYYDLMKHICLEKEGKTGEKSKSVCRDPPKSEKSGNPAKVNYYEIFKRDESKRKVNSGSSYFDATKPRMERPFYNEENRRNLDFKNYRTNNPRTGKARFDSYEGRLRKLSAGNSIPEKVKKVVELLSPPKSYESSPRKDVAKKKQQNSQGKVLLAINVCNDSLILKQVPESAGGTDATNPLSESGEENQKMETKESLSTSGNLTTSGNSMSETNFGTSAGPSSDETGKTQSELLLKTESDLTVYPKSSIDEENESSESPVENPMLKFKAFRKLLNEGFKYLTSFGETEGHDCPKIPKGGRVPETIEEPIKYPKTTIWVRDPPAKEPKKFFNAWRPERQKSTYVADSRQTLVRDRRLPVRSKINDTQDVKARKPLKRNLSFSRGVSSSKMSKREPYREEDFKGKKGTGFWWRSEGTPSGTASPMRQQKPYQSPMRATEVSAIPKRIPPLPKKLKETASANPRLPSRGGMKNDGRKQKKSEKKEEEEGGRELELGESRSDYATPTGSNVEWRFGEKKSLKDMLSETPEEVMNPGGVTGSMVIPEEANERELKKTDLSCGDERNQVSAPQTASNQMDPAETGLGLCCNNPLRTEWDEFLATSFHRDDQKVSEVLNQFMGNISEAWNAAIHLRNLINSKSEPIKEEGTNSSQGEVNQLESNRTNEVVEAFRIFLRIVTNVFEKNRDETLLRRELFLVMKEVLELQSAASPTKTVLNRLPKSGNRTVFHKEIAEIREDVRNMVAEALVSQGETFSTAEDFEPGKFVAALKEAGEKLKCFYLTEELKAFQVERESEKEVSRKAEEAVPQPKKIYYRPPKKNARESMQSNLQSLADKIHQIYKAREERQREEKGDGKEEKAVLKKLACSQSSVYFDASDGCHQSVEFRDLTNPQLDRVPLNTVDENYFALSGTTFGKYRDLIFNKIITFLQSDNPDKNNYGMTLLGKLMEKDNLPASKKGEGSLEEGRGEKWHDLIDGLIQICHVIESEMKEQLEAVELPDEREIELIRTCEYLKSHVKKMKDLMEEVKSSEEGRARALEESRRTNRKRELIAETDVAPKSLVNSSYLENAIAFINTVGTIGSRIDRFSKNFFPSWLAGRGKDEESSKDFRETSDSVLECNKSVVMSLRKNIEKRQMSIEDMMDQLAREGVDRKEGFYGERLGRKLRDLKKCYILLKKLICDPTMMPPKWLKLLEDEQELEEGGEGGGGICEKNLRPETDYHVMTALNEAIFRRTTPDVTSLVRYSRSIDFDQSKKIDFDQFPIGLLTLIDVNLANDDVFECDLQVEGQGQSGKFPFFQRPKTN